MNYVDAINKVLEHEGGFVNDPSDSGGATNFGITQKVYEAFKGRTVSVLEIQKMPKSDAILIYKREYWDKVQGDNLKSYKVAFALFDQAVNRGPSSAIKAAQKVVGIPQDGKIGAATLGKINQTDEKVFLEKFLADAIAFYNKLAVTRPKDAKFLSGWLSRVNSISDYVGVKPYQAVGGIVFLLVGIFLLIQFGSKNKLV